MSFLNIFSKVASGLSSAISFLDEHKVAETLGKTTSLLSVAVPIAKTVASLTPTTTDDRIVEIIDKWAIPTSILFKQGATGLDKLIKDGAKQKIAVELLRDEMLKIVLSGGKVPWGKEILTTTQQIFELDPAALAAVAEQAHQLVKQHDPEPAKPASPPAEQPAPAATAEPEHKYNTPSEIKARIEELREKLGKTTDPEKVADLTGKIEKQKKRLAEAEAAEKS